MLSSTHSAAQPLPGGPSRAARPCTRAKGRIQTVGNYRRDDDEAEGGVPADPAALVLGHGRENVKGESRGKWLKTMLLIASTFCRFQRCSRLPPLRQRLQSILCLVNAAGRRPTIELPCLRDIALGADGSPR
jgi:hypothetical protein